VALSTGALTILGAILKRVVLFNLHKNSTVASVGAVTVNINSDDDASGDFSQTGGIISFDNSGTKSHLINIYSPNVTFGGSGSMTNFNPGLNTSFGQVTYNHASANYSHTGSSYSIQQVDQTIATNKKLVVISGDVLLTSILQYTQDLH